MLVLEATAERPPVARETRKRKAAIDHLEASSSQKAKKKRSQHEDDDVLVL